MDVVWLIVDSLSFETTSFSEDGPDTTPGLSSLADDSGLVYTNAYAPGPLSPSSHASMFTGELPSVGGMHESYPHIDTSLETIAEAMSESHHTSLFSTNVWLSQGLNRGFDVTDDFSGPELPFPDAADPTEFFDQSRDSAGLLNVWELIMSGKKPIRSMLNFLDFKRRRSSSEPSDGGQLRHITEINDAIRAVRADTAGDHFVVANYMDIHPPLTASQEALEKFAPDYSTDELPIGIPPERHIENEYKSYDVDAMEQLYRAAIWDFDREFTPLVEELVNGGAFVIVTSDHGIWNRNTAYSDSRLRVPLIIFSPDHGPETVPHTVNLRSLPRTIAQHVLGDDTRFSGTSLLDVDTDQVSITEVIHHPNDVYDRTGRVDVTKTEAEDRDVQRDLVLIQGDARIEYVKGEWTDVSGAESSIDELRSIGSDILSNPVVMGDKELTYEDDVKKRLEDLGYM